MALKAIIAVDHCPPGDPAWLAYMGYGLFRGGNLGAVNQSTIENGWMKARNAASGQDYIAIPLDRFLAGATNRITVGVRLRFTSWVNSGSAIATLSGGASNTFLVDSNIPGPVTPGQMMYLEFAYTISSGTLERRLNGVSLGNVAIAGTRSFTLNLYHKASTTNMIDFRDIYVTDDTGTEATYWLGPVQSSPAALAVNEAVDYTTFPAGGSVAAAVYSPGSIPTDLVALSPSARNPLKAALSASLPPGVEIFGMELGMGGRSDAVTPTVISGKVTVGGTDKALTNVSLPSSVYNYDKSFGVLMRAPDGSKWTQASINSALLTLQPEA